MPIVIQKFEDNELSIYDLVEEGKTKELRYSNVGDVWSAHIQDTVAVKSKEHDGYYAIKIGKKPIISLDYSEIYTMHLMLAILINEEQPVNTWVLD